MKIKISRILGVAISLALLLSMMGVAIPVAAAPGDLTYGITSTPSKIGKVLAEQTDVNFLVAAADGVTMFAWDSANGTGLYKSTDAGVTWTQTSINTGAVLTGTVLAMAVSPNYAADTSLVAVTADRVFYSSNGGGTFTDIAYDNLVIKREGGSVTSVDIAKYYADNTLSIIVGVTEGAGTDTYSNVLKFKLGGFTWDEVSTSTNQLSDNASVIAVAFSPAHLSDAQILAVSNNGTHTYLNTVFGSNAWNTNIFKTNIGTPLTILSANATGAVFGFGSDYNGLTTNTILVGTSGSGIDDVIRVSNLALGATATAKDINVTADTANEVKSIAVTGTVAAGTVLVGLTGSNNVYRSSTVTASTPTWTASGKHATGAANVIVLWAGGSAYAATTGADSAVSRSTDGGANFNQLSLIDVSASANMSLVASEVVNANTIFLIMNNSSGGSYAARSLFRTTDAGATWQRILTGTTLATVKASPNYATDSTIYVASTGAALLQKSSNGGDTFTNIGAPAAITALYVVDGNTYYTGHSGGFYKSGLWQGATGLVSGVDVASIAVSGSTIVTGNKDGDVHISTNGGTSFTMVGADDSLGDGATVTVLLDKDFASNSTIYAGSDNGTYGIKRATSTSTSATWTEIDDGAGDLNDLVVNGLAQGADGTLYAASGTAAKGIRRSLDPTTVVGAVAGTAPYFESMTGTVGTITINTADYHDFALTTSTKSPNAMLINLALVSGSNVLYALDTAYLDTGTTYGYVGRLLGIKDTLTTGPAPSSPKSGAKLTTTTTASLVWGAVATADTYSALVSTDKTVPSTTAGVTVPATSSTTTAAVSAMTAGATYYWKARVVSPLRSRYSAISSFTLALAATGGGAVTTLTPAPGTTAVSTTPVLSWPTSTGATGYVVQIAEDPTFKILDDSATTTNTIYVVKESLAYATTYYWRVKATTASTESDWTLGVFTTAAKPVPPEKIVFPEPLPPVEIKETKIVIEQPPKTEIQIVEVEKTVPVAVTIPQPIPSYLLWTIIAIGAVLFIALIILIVRTRRVA